MEAFERGLAETIPHSIEKTPDGIVVKVSDLNEFAAAANAVKLTSRASDDRWRVLIGGQWMLLRVAAANQSAARRCFARLQPYFSVRATGNSFVLHLLSQTGLPCIFRIRLRLGGIFRIDLCLGEAQ